MVCRIFAWSNLTAVAVLGSLLVPPFAAAQQGQHLYEWSGGGRSSSGPSYRGGYGNFATPAPSYYTAPGSLPSGPMTGYQAFYPPQGGYLYGSYGTSAAATALDVNRAVWLNVSVPANAEIWFDGAKTAQRGAFRQFITPPLAPGQDYAYDVKVRWPEDGREVTRRLTVHAGDVVNLVFDSGTAP
jgi:uncharacterized protein (TIGR03000 family)